MPVIKVHDKQFTPYLTEADITRQIKSIAEKINKDYEGDRASFIAILTGSHMSASELLS